MRPIRITLNTEQQKVLIKNHKTVSASKIAKLIGVTKSKVYYNISVMKLVTGREWGIKKEQIKEDMFSW